MEVRYQNEVWRGCKNERQIRTRHSVLRRRSGIWHQGSIAKAQGWYPAFPCITTEKNFSCNVEALKLVWEATYQLLPSLYLPKNKHKSYSSQILVPQHTVKAVLRCYHFPPHTYYNYSTTILYYTILYQTSLSSYKGNLCMFTHLHCKVKMGREAEHIQGPAFYGPNLHFVPKM